MTAVTGHFYDQPVFVGQAIFTQGEPGYHMYFLVNGEVEILVDGVKVNCVRAPALLGENAILQPGVKSTATVRGTEVSDCLAMHTVVVSRELHREFPGDMARVRRFLDDKKTV